MAELKLDTLEEIRAAIRSIKKGARVPYNGGNQDVDLGVHDFLANNITARGDIEVQGQDIRTGANNSLNLGDDSNCVSIGKTDELWSRTDWDANANLWINYRGFAGLFTQYRDTYIGNGRGVAVLFVDGSTQLTHFTNFVRASTAIYRRYYHLSLASLDPGASGATWVDADANTLCGWQLNATGETLETGTDVHPDWDGVSDLDLEMSFTVNVDNSAGGAGDTVAFVIDVYYKGAGDTATKSQTITESVVVGACAQWTQFEHEFVIDYNALGNLVDVGDVMCMSMHIVTATGDVNNITVNDLSFYYHTTHVGIEQGDT